MGTLSTHVLDTSLGMPARGVRVRLDPAPSPTAARARTEAAEPLGEGLTDDDGRLATIGPARLAAGSYRLTFYSGPYFATTGRSTFYPEVVIVFTVVDPDEHHHVPVLLNPFGYTTYRGS